jgi:hypothetical protein
MSSAEGEVEEQDQDVFRGTLFAEAPVISAQSSLNHAKGCFWIDKFLKAP